MRFCIQVIECSIFDHNYTCNSSDKKPFWVKKNCFTEPEISDSDSEELNVQNSINDYYCLYNSNFGTDLAEGAQDYINFLYV